MKEERRDRVTWLGCRIAEREGGKWLTFDKEAKRFEVSSEYEVELDMEMPVKCPSSVDGEERGGCVVRLPLYEQRKLKVW
jgi:hypothetical protein